MNLREMTWQGQLTFFIFIGLLVFGLFYLGWYKGKSSELARLEARLSQLTREVNLAKEKEKELALLKKENADLEAKLEKLKKVLPEKKEISKILKDVQKLATDVHLNVVSFVPKPSIDRGLVAEWPIEIEVTGSYHNLGYFFDKLGKFTRIFNVSSIEIKALRKQTADNTIDAKFTASTYIFVEKKLEEQQKTRKRGRRRRRR